MTVESQIPSLNETPNWSGREILEAAREFRGQVAKVFAKDGKFPPVAFLFCTKDPEGTELLKKVMSIPIFQDMSPEVEKGLSDVIRNMSAKGRAEAVVFVSPVWLVHGNLRDPDVASNPKRSACILMTIEHPKLGGIAWMADIVLPEDKTTQKAVLGEWRGEENFPLVIDKNMPRRWVHLLPGTN